jgi:hypothetical protein
MFRYLRSQSRRYILSNIEGTSLSLFSVIIANFRKCKIILKYVRPIYKKLLKFCYESKTSLRVRHSLSIHTYGELYFAGIEILTAVVTKSYIFWDITPSSLLKIYGRFPPKRRLTFEACIALYMLKTKSRSFLIMT